METTFGNCQRNQFSALTGLWMVIALAGCDSASSEVAAPTPAPPPAAPAVARRKIVTVLSGELSWATADGEMPYPEVLAGTTKRCMEVLRAAAERDHRDHRAHADHDAEHREERAQLVRLQRLERDLDRLAEQHG